MIERKVLVLSCSDCSLVITSAKQQDLLPVVIAVLKPVMCPKCNKMFVGAHCLTDHSIVHRHTSFNLTGQKIGPANEAQARQGEKLVPR